MDQIKCPTLPDGDYMPPEGEINIRGLRFYSYHGVSEQERKVGNDFKVDISLRYNAEDAMLSDNIERAINYAEASETVKEIMNCPCRLLERVCYNIATALKKKYGPNLLGGKVTVTKLCPPMGLELDGVSFTYCW